jgi:hypothetical protein
VPAASPPTHSQKIDPRQVSARPGEAGDKTELDRVFADAKDDRGRRGRSFGHLGSIVAGWRGNNGHAPTHEVRDFSPSSAPFALARGKITGIVTSSSGLITQIRKAGGSCRRL